MSYSPWEAVRGVEVPWLVLGAGGLILAAGLIRLARTAHRPRLAVLHRDEQGITYSMNYVLVIPIYLLIVCMVVEATFLVTAKIGTMYAAHAGARSAVVWDSANPPELPGQAGPPVGPDRDGPVRQRQPEATGRGHGPAGRRRDRRPGLRQGLCGPLAVAGRQRCQPGRPPGQVPRGRRPDDVHPRRGPVSARRGREGDGHLPGPDVHPRAARLFDQDGQAPYEYTIQTTAILPNEAPVSADRKLGIDYRSR